MLSLLNKWLGLIIVVAAVMWLIIHGYLSEKTVDKLVDKIPNVKIEKKVAE